MLHNRAQNVYNHARDGGVEYNPPCRLAPNWARALVQKRACFSSRDEAVVT